MKAQGSSTRLVIFVKAPRPGQVKTRLAAGLGESAACAAYKRIVEQLMENLRGLENIEIRFSPDDAEGELRQWLGENFIFTPQGSGDLGEKLHRAFQENFDAGAERVVVIGSDCPYVTPEDIEAAWSSLAAHDVVLGPASDGGYWLVGLRELQPVLFKNIPWSAESVLETTLTRVREAQLSFQLLHKLDDIDVLEDWQIFLRSRSS